MNDLQQSIMEVARMGKAPQGQRRTAVRLDYSLTYFPPALSRFADQGQVFVDIHSPLCKGRGNSMRPDIRPSRRLI